MHPFGQESPNAGKAGEKDILRLIQKHLDDTSPPPPQGIGDDCATWMPPAGETVLLTTDPVIFGRHFDASHEPEHVGAKLLKRNLSDIAAMGGHPGPAILALAMGPDVQLEWLTRFIDGLAVACTNYNTPLAGGDIAATEPGTFIATLSQTGSAAKPITRAGATDGSPILVTGTLGGSLTGRHLHFQPRLPEGQWLAIRKEVLSMTDISDGLAKDLPGLLPAGMQAILDIASLPIDEAVQATGANAITQALCDGEDYELLFSLNPQTDLDAFLEAWPFDTNLCLIGSVCRGEPAGILIDKITGNRIRYGNGYEHFKTTD
jgi:thiamine-monophosphate kinase